MSMTVDLAVRIVSETLGATVADILVAGQPEGRNSEWGFDAQLVLDIAKACEDCMERDRLYR